MSNDDQKDENVVRGRPGRRSVEDRRSAVMELLSGKASVDQLARRYGVKPETIEGWCEEAVEAIDEALLLQPGLSDSHDHPSRFR
jgi:transposase-like protein